jgi:putative DNA primase/helicase
MTEVIEMSEHWQSTLQRAEKGGLKKTQYNVTKILGQSPDFRGVIAYDEFKRAITKRQESPIARGGIGNGEVGEWNDDDTTRTIEWLDKQWSLSPSREMVWAAVSHVSSVNKFHPVRDYLQSRVWDGRQRLPTMLSRFFGASETGYSAEIGKRFLIAAVARILRPGCKVDTMLVLEGRQGARKSSAIRALFGEEWFSDTLPSLAQANEAALAIRGKWGQEVPELEAIRGAAGTAVKAFLSRQSDYLREKYGKTYRDHPRQCVFIGTTNEHQYLHDRTGNRRYWPVNCDRIDVPGITENRDQLWAEARTRFELQERWWLDTDELEGAAREQVKERESREAWFEPVAKWLDDPFVIEPGTGNRRNLQLHHGLTSVEILSGALGIRPGDVDGREQQRIGYVMKKLGWSRKEVQYDGRREYRYFETPPTPKSDPADAAEKAGGETL